MLQLRLHDIICTCVKARPPLLPFKPNRMFVGIRLADEQSLQSVRPGIIGPILRINPAKNSSSRNMHHPSGRRRPLSDDSEMHNSETRSQISVSGSFPSSSY